MMLFSLVLFSLANSAFGVTNNIFISSVSGTDSADCGTTQAKACATISAGFASLLKQPDEPGVVYSLSIDATGKYSSGTAATAAQPLVLFDHASVQVQGNGAVLDGKGKCAASPFVLAIPPTADQNVSLHLFSLTITNFRDCASAAVVLLDQRESSYPTRVVVNNVHLLENTAKLATKDSIASCGGGLFLLGSATAVSASESDAPAIIADSSFVANEGPSGAGACIVNTDVVNSTFVGNVGRGGAGYGQADGGGLMLKVVTSPSVKVALTLTNVTFNDNEVDGDGGGFYLTAGRLGNSNKNAPLSVNMAELAFSGNGASGYGGGMFDNFGAVGAVYTGRPVAVCTGCLFTGNSATVNGGAMALMGSATSFSNLEIVGNTCVRGFGAGIFVGLPKDDVALGINLAPVFDVVTASENTGEGKNLDLYCLDAPLVIEQPKSFSSLCTSGCTNLLGECACQSCGADTPSGGGGGGLGAGWVFLILLLIGGIVFGAFKFYKRSRSQSGRSTYLAL